MFGNISVSKLAILITVSTGIIIGLVLYLLYSIMELNVNNGIFILAFALCLGVIYFTTFYLLKKYISSKLKVIYNIIRKSQVSTSGSKKNDFDSTNIDKVNSEVLQWAADTDKRIKSLQTLAQYRKEFVGNVSHELKTPIFSLQGYLHTLLDGGIYDESINLKYIERAADNADRLQHIVEDLESIGNIESGTMDLKMERFDIYQLIRAVFQEQKKPSAKRNIRLSLGTDGDLPVYVNADKGAIRQVLNNLVTNSIKYGEEGGHTKISIFNLDTHLLVEVADDGEGIAEKHLEHLFGRFYRVDSSRSRNKGGSGLGLAIVKHLVEAHDETINVRSTYGEGSTFGFTLRKG